MAAPEYLVVGHVRRPHGIRGEVQVELLTSHPEIAFAPGRVLRLDAESGGAELTVVSTRPHKGGLLVQLEGVETRSAAEALLGRDLSAPSSELAPLEAGEVYYHDLVGLEVATPDGVVIGRVREVYEAQPADLLAVSMGEREVLVPFSRRVVRSVDVAGGRLVIEPPEGLLDL